METAKQVGPNEELIAHLKSTGTGEDKLVKLAGIEELRPLTVEKRAAVCKGVIPAGTMAKIEAYFDGRPVPVSTRTSARAGLRLIGSELSHDELKRADAARRQPAARGQVGHDGTYHATDVTTQSEAAKPAKPIVHPEPRIVEPAKAHAPVHAPVTHKK